MDKLDIMRAIKSRGFLAKDIAEKLGISVVAMSQRANKDNPTVKSLREVADIIGCDVRDLFYKVDEDGNIIEDEHQQQELFSQREEAKTLLPSNEPTDQAERTDGNLYTARDAAEHTIKFLSPQAAVETTTFCPHCGKKVRVGVVLLPEE